MWFRGYRFEWPGFEFIDVEVKKMKQAVIKFTKFTFK